MASTPATAVLDLCRAMTMEELLEVESAIALEIQTRRKAVATTARTDPGTLVKVRRLNTSFGRKTQRTVSEWVEHEVASGGSCCSSFGWRIEKCQRDVVASKVAAGELGPAVQRLCKLAWQAIEAGSEEELAAAIGSSTPAATDQLYLYLYKEQQCQRLTVGEMTFLLDAMTAETRSAVQFGPLLRSINGRSCPAAQVVSAAR